jgi:hypothetical protein
MALFQHHDGSPAAPAFPQLEETTDGWTHARLAFIGAHPLSVSMAV